MTPEQERLMIEINEGWDEIHASVNSRFRIKQMPTGAGFHIRDFDLYEKFLDSPPDEQAEFMKTVHPDEQEFFERLLLSRIEFEIAEEKSGSITEDRVDRNPERYRWEPK